MTRQIIMRGFVAIAVLAPMPVAADEHDLSTLIGRHVLQVADELGSLTSAPSFARDTVTTCADHEQAVSEMANRFQETGQAQSLLSMAQQVPAAAQEVRTRIATMMVDRLISQGQDALPTIVQDLKAEVLFACYEGALQAAQSVRQPDPAPPTAEVQAVEPELPPVTAPLALPAPPTRPVAEPPAPPASPALNPNTRPVLRPAPDVAEAAPPEPEPAPPVVEAPPPLPPLEPETSPVVAEPGLQPEPPSSLAEPAAPPPSPALDPITRPVPRLAPDVAEVAPPPEPEPAPPVTKPRAQPEAETAPEVAEAAPLLPPALPTPPVTEPPAPPPSLEAETAPEVAEVALQPLPEAEAEAEAEAAQIQATPPPPLLPWGVILSSQSNREVAERQATRIVSLIPEERIDYVQMRVPGQSGLRYVVQVGRPTRAEAEALCLQIKAQGAACMVLRN